MKKFVGYEKGINFGGWFSQCNHTRAHYDTFLTEQDVAEAASWGIDHIRLPVDYELLETEDGTPTSYGMDYLQKMVDWCAKYQLHLLLDLHKTCGYSFDKGEQECGFFTSEVLQERFYRLWERLAHQFGDNDQIAFELLNEVTDRRDFEKWKEISQQCIQRIRKIAPNVYILLGGYDHNCIKAIPDLQLPYDARIVYNFHCYEPIIFTHQGAYWVEGMPETFRLSFPDTTAHYAAQQKKLTAQGLNMVDLVTDSQVETLDCTYFETLFAEAVAVAEARGTTLYCGEYGVIDRADMDSTVAWYQAIHTAFEKYGIGRAAWCYKGLDFGWIDRRLAKKLQPYL